MSAIAVIGAHHAVDGFRLVGAEVINADTPDQVRQCLSALDEDVAVVILTSDAEAAAGDLLLERKGEWVWTTLPL